MLFGELLGSTPTPGLKNGWHVCLNLPASSTVLANVTVFREIRSILLKSSRDIKTRSGRKRNRRWEGEEP